MTDVDKLARLTKLVRYYILYMTTKAGSGHVTSSLSAADIMTCLFFEKLRFNVNDPENFANDRVIFSKGHASPLLYALWTVAGVIDERELDSYRQLGSKLEGHPTPRFKYVDVATGSLGQGLSIGLGMAIALRAQNQKSKIPTKSRLASGGKNQKSPKVYVLMGDSEFAEGSVWEAVEIASYYKLGNLVGILDVNRLGQSGETMLGWDVEKYKARVEAFGWQANIIDGHDLKVITDAFDDLANKSSKPQMIIAKTIKGRGISFVENKEGWHGVVLKQEEFEKAVKELGEVDKSLRGELRRAESTIKNQQLRIRTKDEKLSYKMGEEVATRKAYGESLVRIGKDNPSIVALDAEVKNSTFAQEFKDKFPERFYEMFIAEQNMVGAALGLAKMGRVPFVSTFAAFFTRAYDQTRMSSYSLGNIKFVGSHVGVSIGQDGPSQMGLEDLAMFRAIQDAIVFCPTDAVSCARLVEIAAANFGIFYIRTQRPATPVIYKNDQKFRIGGSNVVKSTSDDKITIVTCGIACIEALKAAERLSKNGIGVRVVDAYSIKPIDKEGLRVAAYETGGLIITCEDHYLQGGLGDAVLDAFADDRSVAIYKIGVSKIPMSGTTHDLLKFEGINADSIADKVLAILG